MIYWISMDFPYLLTVLFNGKSMGNPWKSMGNLSWKSMGNLLENQKSMGNLSWLNLSVDQWSQFTEYVSWKIYGKSRHLDVNWCEFLDQLNLHLTFNLIYVNGDLEANQDRCLKRIEEKQEKPCSTLPGKSGEDEFPLNMGSFQGRTLNLPEATVDQVDQVKVYCEIKHD